MSAVANPPIAPSMRRPPIHGSANPMFQVQGAAASRMMSEIRVLLTRALDRQHVIAPKSARAGESVSTESVVSRPGLEMCLMWSL